MCRLCCFRSTSKYFSKRKATSSKDLDTSKEEDCMPEFFDYSDITSLEKVCSDVNESSSLSTGMGENQSCRERGQIGRDYHICDQEQSRMMQVDAGGTN